MSSRPARSRRCLPLLLALLTASSSFWASREAIQRMLASEEAAIAPLQPPAPSLPAEAGGDGGAGLSPAGAERRDRDDGGDGRDAASTPPSHVMKVVELHRLTEGREGTGYLRYNESECAPPKKYYHNRIVLPRNGTERDADERRLIPKILHLSFVSRCLPQDVDMYVKRWEDKLPDHSIVFHDDHAVHDLLYSSKYMTEWSRDFPWLATAMKCVLNKGAMLIDVWRLVVLWRFGGIYADIDTWPEDDFDVEKYYPDADVGRVSAFFFSDVPRRPTQWFMAMEERHPIAYLGIETVVDNILNMPYEQVKSPPLIKVTGPKAVSNAYSKFLNHAGVSLGRYRRLKRGACDHVQNATAAAATDTTMSEDNDTAVVPPCKVNVYLRNYGASASNKHIGRQVGMSDKVVLKHGVAWKPGMGLATKKFYHDFVEYRKYNATTGETRTKNVTRATRIHKQSNTMHWHMLSGYGTGDQRRLCRREQQRWKNATTVEVKMKNATSITTTIRTTSTTVKVRTTDHDQN